jgi:hypothetical protein
LPSISWTTSPYDAFSLFFPCPESVCTASQTSAAMTISGKSALRKKRFKKTPLDAGYQPSPALTTRGSETAARHFSALDRSFQTDARASPCILMVGAAKSTL